MSLFLHVAEASRTQMLVSHKLAPQMAELEHRLQETEYQKQQSELERDATVVKMNAKENPKAQCNAQLGKFWWKDLCTLLLLITCAIAFCCWVP